MSNIKFIDIHIFFDKIMALFSRQAQAFLAVAEELHFGRAAQRLHISQPPLSQQVQQFEAQVGARLIDRTTRSVRLTAAGRIMLTTLQRMAADSQTAIDAARQVASGVAGFLRLGFTSTAAYRLVPAVLGIYHAGYPDVHLTMQERTSDALLQDLQSERLDLALMRRYDDMPGHGMVFAEIDREPLVVALPMAHPLARRRTIPIRLLAETALIDFARASSQYFHTMLRELFASNGVAPRYVAESVLPTILALVESAVGVAIVPASVCELRPGGVAYRPLVAPVQMDSVLFAVYRSDSLNPTVGAFLAVMADWRARRLQAPEAAR